MSILHGCSESVRHGPGNERCQWAAAAAKAAEKDAVTAGDDDNDKLTVFQSTGPGPGTGDRRVGDGLHGTVYERGLQQARLEKCSQVVFGRVARSIGNDLRSIRSLVQVPTSESSGCSLVLRVGDWIRGIVHNVCVLGPILHILPSKSQTEPLGLSSTDGSLSHMLLRGHPHMKERSRKVLRDWLARSLEGFWHGLALLFAAGTLTMFFRT